MAGHAANSCAVYIFRLGTVIGEYTDFSLQCIYGNDIGIRNDMDFQIRHQIGQPFGCFVTVRYTAGSTAPENRSF